MPDLTLVPVTFSQACEFVDASHRHHARPRGHKFSIGVESADGVLVGVIMVGRPTARALDDGLTLEVTRSCTDGTPNANSMLYGAAWRAAKACGYRRLITYTQDGESGASLRGAGWKIEATLRPRRGWSTPSRPRENKNAGVGRIRWAAP